MESISFSSFFSVGLCETTGILPTASSAGITRYTFMASDMASVRYLHQMMQIGPLA